MTDQLQSLPGHEPGNYSIATKHIVYNGIKHVRVEICKEDVCFGFVDFNANQFGDLLDVFEKGRRYLMLPL